MKKISLTAMVLAVAALFAACTKDGVYNPSEKISRVYESSSYSYSGYYNDNSTTPKHLTELWHWDGKKLASIDHYSSNGSISRTYNFTYDGKQLTRIDCYTANYYSEITYDGGKLKRMNTYSNGTLRETAEVTYDGSKVSKIVMTYNGKDIATKDAEAIEMTADLYKIMFPCFNKESYTKHLATKGVETYTLELTWDGSNISQRVATSGSYKSTSKYTYDSKKNPYQNFLDAGLPQMFSKNNVTAVVETYQDNGGTETENTNYNYTYDGNWPTMRSYSSTYTYTDEDDPEYSYTRSSTYITYWEYED